jgi:hypothetical protein
MVGVGMVDALIRYWRVVVPYLLCVVWGFHPRLDPAWTAKPWNAIAIVTIGYLAGGAFIAPVPVILMVLSPVMFYAWGGLRKNLIYEPRLYLSILPWIWFLVETSSPLLWIVFLVGWIIVSVERAFHFRSEYHFWTEAYRESPDNPQVVTNKRTLLTIEIREELQRSGMESTPRLKTLLRELETIDPLFRQVTHKEIDCGQATGYRI